ncbi:SDR family NAD(P)-dependent oxidoreductase [Streptomyces sp. NPDC058206]|uniref:SDR family NAD(P)-dependent oxidoreductase n=1 Tax=Streptomyces sp. NPDC058206 TaxID=3346382 RepID=UPI0036E3BA34
MPAASDAQAAVGRFGRIDVLVNNAGNFFAGYFEEITPDQMRRQIETNLFGPMNVTRAVLPIMRKQRDGHVITLSSSAGLTGQEFCVAYAASKFGVEGWMESLRYDVEPFNIRTTVVEPGFFRTEPLVDASTTWPEPTIDDYAERTRATIEAWKSMNGRHSGDPAKLARALLTIAGAGLPRTGRQPRLRRPQLLKARPRNEEASHPVNSTHNAADEPIESCDHVNAVNSHYC